MLSQPCGPTRNSAPAPPFRPFQVRFEDSDASSVVIHDGKVRFEECAFNRTRATPVVVTGGEVAFDLCSFTQNNASAVPGGAIRVLGGDVRVRNTDFVENTALTGGAVHVDNSPSATSVVILTQITATGNTARRTGGALNVVDGYLRLENSLLGSNYAGGEWDEALDNAKTQLAE